MRIDLYNCEDRQVDGTLNILEPALGAALHSKGMYEVSVEVEPTDTVEDCEIGENSLLVTYVPKPRTIGCMTCSSAYGWIYNMYDGNKVFHAGSADKNVLKEAREYAVANNKIIKVFLCPIEGDGLPVGVNG